MLNQSCGHYILVRSTNNIKPLNGSIYCKANVKKFGLDSWSVKMQRSGRFIMTRMCKAFFSTVACRQKKKKKITFMFLTQHNE